MVTSIPSSSLLANSAFSSLDIFALQSRAQPQPPHSHTPQAELISLNSTCPSPSPSYSSGPSSTSFGHRLSFEAFSESWSSQPLLHRLLDDDGDMPAVPISPTTLNASDFPSPPPRRASTSATALGPPLVLASPQGEDKKEAARRSVRLGKDGLVNWARPLWAGKEVDEAQATATRIFGASLQRNRRLQASAPSPLPSPSISSDGGSITPLPLTPTYDTDLSAHTPEVQIRATSTSGWYAPDVALKGLGVSGIDLAVLNTPEQARPAKVIPAVHSVPFSFDFPSSTPIKFGAVTTTQAVTAALSTPPVRTKLTSSQSLNSFASPMTLAELRSLRQAALDLQAEARGPLKNPRMILDGSQPSHPPIPARSSSRAEIAPEKRIRRKAVPLIPEEPESASVIPPIPPPNSRLTRAALTSQSVLDLEEARDRFDALSLARPVSGTANRIREQPTRRGFYANSLGTMSVIEISPRTRTLPFATPHRRAAGPVCPPTPIAEQTAIVPDPLPVPAMSRSGSSSSSGSTRSSRPGGDGGNARRGPLPSMWSVDWTRPKAQSSKSGSSSGSGPGSGSDSSSSSVSDQPVTPASVAGPGSRSSESPGIYGGRKEAFLSMLDLRLATIGESKPTKHRRQVSAGSAEEVGPDGREKKLRRGLSRFFGRS